MKDMAYRLDLAICSVIVDDEQQYVETRFLDGSKVGAVPNYDKDSLKRAADMGYKCWCPQCWGSGSYPPLTRQVCSVCGAGRYGRDGSRFLSPDVWRMTVDHEIAHSWLAFLDGKESIALWTVAHELEATNEVFEEEATILTYQSALPKDHPRPWDFLQKPFHWPA